VELTLDPPSQNASAGTPEPTLASVVGLNLRSSVGEAGALSFGTDSHAPGNLLQRLSNNSWWTEAAALMSIPAGAAARGERNGWSGDAAFGSESECFDFDTGAFFRHYLAMVVDAQAPNGEIGGGVPDQGTSPTTTHHDQVSPFDPSWSAVFPVVAFNVWKYYRSERAPRTAAATRPLARRTL
jgi:alpha-L-rhamnosidase